MRIGAEYVERHRYTAGRPGLSWYEDKHGPHKSHSATCRDRLEITLNETEGGEARMNITKARKAKYQTEKDTNDEENTMDDNNG